MYAMWRIVPIHASYGSMEADHPSLKYAPLRSGAFEFFSRAAFLEVAALGFSADPHLSLLLVPKPTPELGPNKVTVLVSGW
jgi:hypothetical protein